MFTTQADIYRALLDGKRLRRKGANPDYHVMLREGMLIDHRGLRTSWTFDDPSNWLPYEKVEGYEEIIVQVFYQSKTGKIFEFDFGSKECEAAKMDKSMFRMKSRDFIRRVPIYEGESNEHRARESNEENAPSSDDDAGGEPDAGVAREKTLQALANKYYSFA